MKTELRRESPDKEDLEAAHRVLQYEIEGIRALAAVLDGTLVRALDILAAVEGRVVVTGMGKSGHIGRKIAATLASTGTPALFVHPAEAGHGDLGMITKGDAVIAISYSGEAAEILGIVPYTRRFSIPLVAITGKAESSIAQAADVALILPDSTEACPMGLAPTTSTTVTLALGDAIAVALLQRKGFSADEFHILHPGGQLGRQLLRVRDIMHTGEEMPLVRAGVSMQEALLEMTGKRLGCVGIVDEAGKLVGIVTDGDLRRHMEDDLLLRSVDEVMTRGPHTIRAEALAAESVRIMNSLRITALFAVADDVPIGIVQVHDVLRAGVV